MRRWTGPLLAGLFLAALFSPLRPAAAAEAVDPHDTRMTDCTNCHTADIYTEDCHDNDGFCLVARSVDDLCLTCHVKKECCLLGQEHQAQLFLGAMSHPSDLDRRDVDPAHLPENLPLQDDRITCHTCHLHSRSGEGDYKLLRLVEVRGQKVDWSMLCLDCHDDY